VRRDLLVRFLRDYPFQPATALWRAVEVEHLLSSGLPDGRGLDLGCGDGLLTRIVLEEAGNRDVVGVDTDPAEAAQAKGLGIYAAVHVTGGDRVPEQDGSFDWVLSNSVLEHIDDLEPVLAEMARILSPGGQFVFTVPGPDFHACLHGPVLPGLSRDDYVRRLDARLAHLRYWGREQWEAALGRHGMSIERLSCYLTVSEVQRWESISRLTAGVLYGLGRRRRRPIEIQRRLGMRKQGRRMPVVVARAVAGATAAGLKDSSPLFGCLLIRASRVASAPRLTAGSTG
jgi:SAM-dependent methyltransferase